MLESPRSPSRAAKRKPSKEQIAQSKNHVETQLQAIRENDLNYLKTLCTLQKPTFHCINLACELGFLPIVIYLTLIKTDCDESAMDLAAANGHLDLVQWLHENRSEGCSTAALNGAAKNCFIDVVKWMVVNRLNSCDLVEARGCCGTQVDSAPIAAFLWSQIKKKRSGAF